MSIETALISPPVKAQSPSSQAFLMPFVTALPIATYAGLLMPFEFGDAPIPTKPPLAMKAVHLELAGAEQMGRERRHRIHSRSGGSI